MNVCTKRRAGVMFKMTKFTMHATLAEIVQCRYMIHYRKAKEKREVF